MRFTELPGAAGGGAGAGDGLTAARDGEPDPLLTLIDDDVRELLRENREAHERLIELAREE